MSQEKALVPAPSLAEAQEREERKALRVKKRQTKLASLLVDAQLVAVDHHNLKHHVFKTDQQLRELQFTDAQIALVRGWESPKKSAPFALESSSTIVTSMLRRDNEKKSVHLNVERLIVKLPERGGADLPEPITVEAEVISK